MAFISYCKTCIKVSVKSQWVEALCHTTSLNELGSSCSIISYFCETNMCKLTFIAEIPVRFPHFCRIGSKSALSSLTMMSCAPAF